MLVELFGGGNVFTILLLLLKVVQSHYVELLIWCLFLELYPTVSKMGNFEFCKIIAIIFSMKNLFIFMQFSVQNFKIVYFEIHFIILYLDQKSNNPSILYLDLKFKFNICVTSVLYEINFKYVKIVPNHMRNLNLPYQPKKCCLSKPIFHEKYECKYDRLTNFSGQMTENQLVLSNWPLCFLYTIICFKYNIIMDLITHSLNIYTHLLTQLYSYLIHSLTYHPIIHICHPHRNHKNHTHHKIIQISFFYSS